ncbi:hypothetical protein BDV35DRAFT_43744 [Aspergillus flavus]|uniref:Uncharacterized protein n=1 Tax=Aspergillus flavus TaxID=5059 RepID=A0A5N6GJK5_ASPFL|nr:hypothetical protein BDV35DRAFT_43744 [Aspergillus flavus]
MRLSILILMGSSPARKTLLGRFDRRTVRYGSIELLNTKSIKSIYFFLWRTDSSNRSAQPSWDQKKQRKDKHVAVRDPRHTRVLTYMIIRKGKKSTCR